MSFAVRLIKDKIFTAGAGFSIVVLMAALVVILFPMLWRGSKAIFFQGTAEFRRLQYDTYNRGDAAKLKTEISEYEAQKARIFDTFNTFAYGIDSTGAISRLKEIYRDFGRDLRFDANEDYGVLRAQAKSVRDDIIEAMELSQRDEAVRMLKEVLAKKNSFFDNTAFGEAYNIAAGYLAVIENMDFSKREIYKQELVEVRELLLALLGPQPQQSPPALIMQRYGATRMDYAQGLIERIVRKPLWQAQDGREKLVQTFVDRSDIFAGTSLEAFFKSFEKDAPLMFKPRFTFYAHYFIDDSTPGHFFGGVGPEIIGTLTLTLMAMVFAVPLGIISAAYLAECAADNLTIKIIRMSINTLAGVPSIVFGLFGMAFFVLYLMPKLGYESKPCILTASMTLAVLVLPVIIRASEEAIKSVPKTYKEASLSLGAGGFRTFVSVTLPAAMPGILTGIILSLSRAAGETAPILFTGAVALGPIPKTILQPTRALSYGAYDMAVGDRIAMLVPHQQYGMVATLIVLVLCLNILAIYVRSKMSAKLRGS